MERDSSGCQNLASDPLDSFAPPYLEIRGIVLGYQLRHGPEARVLRGSCDNDVCQLDGIQNLQFMGSAGAPMPVTKAQHLNAISRLQHRMLLLCHPGSCQIICARVSNNQCHCLVQKAGFGKLTPKSCTFCPVAKQHQLTKKPVV